MNEAQYDLHAEIEDRHWWFAGRRTIVKRLLERVVPPRPDALVIDVGCGTGANVAALASSYRCLGLDESSQAIDHARARFSAVEYVCEAGVGARADRFATASAVLLMDVLEHVEDDFSLLSQVLALLQPGAHVLITVPADPSLWTQHDESFGHWRRYDAERLRATWRGLAVEERLLSYYNARLYPVVKLVRAVSQRRRRAAGAAGTDFTMPPGPLNRALEAFFAGESGPLGRDVDRGRQTYPRGASLIAILRRTEGPIDVRRKPPGLAPDKRSAS
jgi:2-polyprenyl-3-methyl-5-hydroxy-6-metoxy-1,4-benzoquinol methylase